MESTSFASLASPENSHPKKKGVTENLAREQEKGKRKGGAKIPGNPFDGKEDDDVEKKINEASQETERLCRIVLTLGSSQAVENALKKAKVISEELMSVLLKLDALENLDEEKREKKKKVIHALNIGLDLTESRIECFEKQMKQFQLPAVFSKAAPGNCDPAVDNVVETPAEIENESDKEISEKQTENVEVYFFRQMKRVKGKETLQAVVNGVKFYCKRTDIISGNKWFRCSFYNTEGCKATFRAIKTDEVNQQLPWKPDLLENALNHEHPCAPDESVIEIAKRKLKKLVLASQLDSRLKDIYYDFIESYGTSLGQKERIAFDQSFPMYKKIRKTMDRWKKEVIPLAPKSQAEVDTNNKVFFSANGEHLLLGDHVDGNNNRTMTFGEPSTLKSFSESVRINIDTTFKSAPKPDWASVLIFQVDMKSSQLGPTSFMINPYLNGLCLFWEKERLAPKFYHHLHRPGSHLGSLLLAATEDFPDVTLACEDDDRT